MAQSLYYAISFDDISAEHVKGGRLSANTGSTVFDLITEAESILKYRAQFEGLTIQNSSQFIN